jgi:hypothetical protein
METRMIEKSNQHLTSNAEDDTNFFGTAVDHESEVAVYGWAPQHLLNTYGHKTDSFRRLGASRLTPEIRTEHLARDDSHHSSSSNEIRRLQGTIIPLRSFIRRGRLGNSPGRKQRQRDEPQLVKRYAIMTTEDHG